MFELNLIPDLNEKPLDREAINGGYTSIFRKIAIIGDSLTSGEFEGTGKLGEKTYHDFIEDYSWGKFLARACGSEAYVFSRGGMTAMEYCESFADKNDFWNKDKACQCYIIALGVNDIYGGKSPMGTFEDICPEDYTQNGKTYIGYYDRIIRRYKEIQPDAKFFFVAPPIDSTDEKRLALCEKISDALHKFAEIHSNSYVIDLRKYGPEFTGELRKAIFLGGHMTPTGYVLMSKLIGSYIDYIIRHNPDDFRQIGFIGTPYKNTTV